MKALLIWLKGKNWSTHAIAVAALSVAGIITADQQAQQFLLSLLRDHPALAAQIIALAGVITTYKRSSSAAGTVAQAQQIMSSPNPPTPAQVNEVVQAKPAV